MVPSQSAVGKKKQWVLKTRTLRFDREPAIMGIVNVTPDSFSDGGRYFDTDRALDHAMQLVRDGADLVDIGGESTRPYSEPVGPDEELNRVIPVIEAVASRTDIPISIDTSKADRGPGRNSGGSRNHQRCYRLGRRPGYGHRRT